jgi:hypothetical protein
MAVKGQCDPAHICGKDDQSFPNTSTMKVISITEIRKLSPLPAQVAGFMLSKFIGLLHRGARCAGACSKCRRACSDMEQATPALPERARAPWSRTRSSPTARAPKSLKCALQDGGVVHETPISASSDSRIRSRRSWSHAPGCALINATRVARTTPGYRVTDRDSHASSSALRKTTQAGGKRAGQRFVRLARPTTATGVSADEDRRPEAR